MPPALPPPPRDNPLCYDAASPRAYVQPFADALAIRRHADFRCFDA